MPQFSTFKGINRTNDYAFKRILGSEEGKEALVGFLNAVLKPPPGKELTTVELLDRELDPEYLLSRGARLDVLAKTTSGTLLNVEVQIANRYDIDRRTLFYWARLYGSQLNTGQKFIELRKTVTINILGFNWFTSEERYHLAFHIREDETGKILSDDLEMHFLELEKVKKLKQRPKDALEAWLMYLNNLEGEELEAIAMENPAIRKALTIEEAFWRSERERRLYELREKALRDELVMLDGARAEGKVEGIAEGKAVGIAEGKAVGKAEMAQEAICKYLEARFGEASLGLQKKVQTLGQLESLNQIMNKIYLAGSLDDARAIIEGLPDTKDLSDLS
jgi:predicted transposase/invertase (TIGR01784 family)